MTVRAAVVTTSRADYGLLHPLLVKLDGDPRFELRLIVTGSHLAAEHSTVDEIEADALPIFARVELPAGGGDRLQMAGRAGAALTLLADAIDRSGADVVVLLGDRFETFAAAGAAVLLDVPVAHIHGGEVTAGAVDDPLRHAITKMATLHFPVAETYRRRIVQMGAPAWTVFNVGALAVDNVAGTPLMGPDEFLKEFGVACDSDTLLVTFHPVTRGDSAHELDVLMRALDELTEFKVLFTAPNDDAGGEAVASSLERWIQDHPGRAALVSSLGSRGYLSAARNAAAVVGNSSSGLHEVPVLGVPSVDVGTRQEGRERPPSVVHAGADATAIVAAVRHATSPEHRAFSKVALNPYGEGHTAEHIADFLADEDLLLRARRATFVDLQFEEPAGAAPAEGSHR